MMSNHTSVTSAEILESRQLLSVAALGDLNPGSRRTLNFDQATPAYTFTLNRPATFSAIVNRGTNIDLYRDGEKVLSGKRLSTVIPVGRYTITAGTRNAADLDVGGPGGASIKMAVAKTTVPTRLQADVWGSGGVHLSWDDNARDEASYRIDRWTRNGWRRSVRVAANATAAVIDNLTPGSSTTYRVSAVTADGISTRSANIASATTNPVSTDGWYKVNLTAGTAKEASWTLAKDMLKVLPDFRDGNKKMESRWVHAGSWQAAVWTVVSSWNDNTSQNEAVSIRTDQKTAEGDPIFQRHYFPVGGDFKVATGAELHAAPGVSDCDLPNNNTKYIALEDSYGSIDHDYDDFFWKVDVQGVLTPKFDFKFSSFIKYNYIDDPRNNPLQADTIFEGDDRITAGGAAIFDPANNHYRTSQTLTVNPMDVYANDHNQTVFDTTQMTKSTGITNKYDKASSVIGGRIAAAAYADQVLNDGVMKIETGQANTNGLTWYLSPASADRTFEIILHTAASNPLVTGAPGISAGISLYLDYTDPLHPTLSVTGSTGEFPCFELDMFDRTAGAPSTGTKYFSYDSGTKTVMDIGFSDNIVPGPLINLPVSVVP